MGIVENLACENSSQKVKILRDTGATQSLMLESILTLTENSFTDANVLISGVEMGVLEVPLHEVNNKVQFNKWQHCNRYETFITCRYSEMT